MAWGRFCAGRGRHVLSLAAALLLLGGCSTEILFDLPAERERKLADFFQCLQPASRGTCPESRSFERPKIVEPGEGGLNNPFQAAGDPAKGGAELSSARPTGFSQFVDDLRDPLLANGFALSLRQSPELESFLTRLSPPRLARSETPPSAQAVADEVRARKIAAFNRAVTGPAALASAGDATRRDDIAASLLAMNEILNDPVRLKSAQEAETLRAKLFKHEGQADIKKLATEVEGSTAQQLEISISGSTMRDYYETARQVEQRNGFDSYKYSADTHRAYALQSNAEPDLGWLWESRYAAFYKTYISQYFRRGHFVRGYLFEDEFNKLRADYREFANKLLRLEAIPSELIREFEEEIGQAADEAKKKAREDLLPREIASIVEAWRSEEKIKKALEDKYARLATRVKEDARKFGEKQVNQLTAAEREAFLSDIEIILRPYSGEIQALILRQLRRLCFVDAGGKRVVEVVDDCLKSDLTRRSDEFRKQYDSVKVEIEKLAKAYGDYMRKVTGKVDEYLNTLRDKIIVRKDVGSEKFVARNESSYQVPALEYRVSSKGLEYLKLEGDSYIPVIRDFIRVVVEAYFDARHGLPGASASTGVSKMPEPFRLPDIGKVAGVEGSGYDKFKLEDFALVDEKAARVEAITSLGVATLVRGAGPLSIGNEALEAAIETVVSVAARKASEKIFWCIHACNLSPEQAQRATEEKGGDLAARLMSLGAVEKKPQSRRVRIKVTHNPLGMMF